MTIEDMRWQYSRMLDILIKLRMCEYKSGMFPSREKFKQYMKELHTTNVN